MGRVEVLCAKTSASLRMRQFDRLLKVVRERGGYGLGGVGRGFCRW